VRKLAFFGGCGNPLKKRILPCTFFFLLPPNSLSTITGHGVKKALQEGKGRLVAHYRRGLSEGGTECNNTHYCSRKSN
jgi:hypothetical protein